MSESKTISLRGKNSVQVSAIEYTREKIEALKQTVAKGATDAEFEMFLHLARHYNLDPFKKEIWFIKRLKKEKNSKGEWDYPRLSDGSIDYSKAETVVMTSRDGYLSIAMRDPGFAGLRGGVVHANDEFTMTQTLSGEEVVHRFSHRDRGPVVGAWAAALHKERRPVVVYVPLEEYIDHNNQVWKKYTSAMILKVAEALVLKRQFGITGLVTYEEMSGSGGEGAESDSVIIDAAEVTRGAGVQGGELPGADTGGTGPAVLPGGTGPAAPVPEFSGQEGKAGQSQYTLSGSRYSGTVTVVSAPVITRNGSKAVVACTDSDGDIFLVFAGEALGSAGGIEAGATVEVAGEFSEKAGKRYVRVESAEVIPF